MKNWKAAMSKGTLETDLDKETQIWESSEHVEGTGV